MTVLYKYNNLFKLFGFKSIHLEIHNFEVKAHNFKFTKHVSDEQHPSSVEIKMDVVHLKHVL